MSGASVGRRLPSVRLARIAGEELEQVNLDLLLQGRRVILIGLPGAFTPICTAKHLPDLVANAPQLKASGIAEIFCVAPSNPWAMDVWSRQVDPQGQLTFLSDGNLELARAAGLNSFDPDFFLGECSKRFAMILENAVIQRLAVEPRIDMVSCTRADRLLD